MFRSLLHKDVKSTGVFPSNNWSLWDSTWGEFERLFAETSVTGENPSIEIHVNDGKAFIEVELAGYAKENISATVQDRIITISGSRNGTNFVKTFRVEESFDMDSMAARYQDGLLTVTLDKLAEVKPDTKKRTVPIQ